MAILDARREHKDSQRNRRGRGQAKKAGRAGTEREYAGHERDDAKRRKYNEQYAKILKQKKTAFGGLFFKCILVVSDNWISKTESTVDVLVYEVVVQERSVYSLNNLIGTPIERPSSKLRNLAVLEGNPS